jgi:hypothetical protein
LFTRLDFQSDKGLESARGGLLNKCIRPIAVPLIPGAWALSSFAASLAATTYLLGHEIIDREFHAASLRMDDERYSRNKLLLVQQSIFLWFMADSNI